MNRRLMGVLIAVVILGLAIFGVTRLQGQSEPAYSADVVSALSGEDTSGYARAFAPRAFEFPKDHGPHPDFQTEWWYFTGNMTADDGRHFGYEFTIFRRAIAPTLPERTSAWATNQIYFADLAVSDIGGNQFFSRQQFSRGAVDLAGATLDPRFKVWIDDWSMTAQDDAAKTWHLNAADGPIALDLTVQQIKPPTLQGERGLSQKSPESGNASYYYSMTRMPTEGTIAVNGTNYKVNGNSWLDREWSTSVLPKDAVGWDWFALQLDNNRELMLYVIRKGDGSVEPTSHGTLVEADGTTTAIVLNDFKITPTGQWKKSTHRSSLSVGLESDGTSPIRSDSTGYYAAHAGSGIKFHYCLLGRRIAN